MCKTINNVEWSGIIFCKTEGHPIDPKTFSVTAVDILPMHKGEPTYTEFEVDDRLIDAYDNNPELEECKLGIIHSHVNMDVFFSGTDTSTLQEYAKLSNFCVSIIVNNAGKIIGKVAYPVSKKVQSLGTQYKDNDGNWVSIDNHTQEQEIVTIKSIDLNVTYEIDDFFLSKTEQAVNPPKPKYESYNSKFNYSDYDYDYEMNRWNQSYGVNKQTSMFDTPSYSSKPKFTQDDINNFLCKVVMLDTRTNLIDVKSCCQKMDNKLKEIDLELYEAMMIDQIEDCYMEATNSYYLLPSDVEEFISSALEYLQANDLFSTESGNILFEAISEYYSIESDDRKI